jgi:hypothetical protein
LVSENAPKKRAFQDLARPAAQNLARAAARILSPARYDNKEGSIKSKPRGPTRTIARKVGRSCCKRVNSFRRKGTRDHMADAALRNTKRESWQAIAACPFQQEGSRSSSQAILSMITVGETRSCEAIRLIRASKIPASWLKVLIHATQDSRARQRSEKIWMVS